MIIILRRIRLFGHVARMGEIRHSHTFWSNIMKEREHLQDQDVDRRIILEVWIMSIYRNLCSKSNCDSLNGGVQPLYVDKKF
jgi:hypothetical protein